MPDATKNVDQRDSTTFETELLYANGDPIPLSAIDTVTMWLFHSETLLAINSRDEQDVKDTNNVTIGDSDGSFLWDVQPDDTEIVGGREGLPRIGGTEKHIAIIKVVHNTTQEITLELHLVVKRTAKQL